MLRMRQSCQIRGKTTRMILHLRDLLHRLYPRLRQKNLANAPQQRPNALQALLHLLHLLRSSHSLLHRRHLPRAQLHIPRLTSMQTDTAASGLILHSLGNSSQHVQPVSRVRSMTTS